MSSTTKISFGFKKKATTTKDKQISRSTASNCIKSVFDAQGPSCRHGSEDGESRSFVTALGASGFEGPSNIPLSSHSGILPIACPVLLPAPSRGTGQKKEIVPRHRTTTPTRGMDQNKARSRAEEKKPSLEEVSTNKDLNASYGLLVKRREPGEKDEEEEVDELGPPTSLPVTEYQIELKLERHRGVMSTRRLNRKNMEESEVRYDMVPIETFGMAMLAGMGYDPKAVQNQPVELKRRCYAKAGLGADKAFENDLQQQQSTLSPQQSSVPRRQPQGLR